MRQCERAARYCRRRCLRLRPRTRETYHLQWRLDHDVHETLVQSNNAHRCLSCGQRRRHSIWRRNLSGCHHTTRNATRGAAAATAARGSDKAAGAAILPRWLRLEPAPRWLLPTAGPAKPVGLLRKSVPDGPGAPAPGDNYDRKAMASNISTRATRSDRSRLHVDRHAFIPFERQGQCISVESIVVEALR